jgi:RNA polymerase sigma-70 factor (ECF subfamily)
MDADAELMRRVSLGDAQAFRELVRRYEKPMYNFFFRLSRAAEDAEDLTQELFVALYRGSARYRPDAAFKAYIYRIASNLAASHLRKSKLRTTVSMDEMAEQGVEVASRGGGEDPAAALEAEEMRERYEAVLARLPRAWRIAIELRMGGELSCREVAVAMGKSLSSVESILFRARERIARELRAEKKGQTP